MSHTAFKIKTRITAWSGIILFFGGIYVAGTSMLAADVLGFSLGALAVFASVVLGKSL